MSTTLTNGLKLPDKGSVDWYSDMQNNYQILDGAVGTVASKLTNVTATELGYLSGVTSSIQTQLNAKAADSDVVHKSGNETIADNKTFSGGIYSSNYYYGTTAWGLDKYNQWVGVNDFNNLIGLNGAELWFKNSNITDFTTNPAEYGGQSVLQLWNKDTTQYSGGLVDYQATDGSHIFEIVCFGYPLNSTVAYQHRFRFVAYRDGVADFYPTYTNSVNLGTSYNKWKTLNGVNPGALSLPDTSKAEAISTSSFSFDGTSEPMPDTTGLFANGVAQKNGWLVARLSEGVNHFVFLNSDEQTGRSGILSSCLATNSFSGLIYGLNAYVPITVGSKPSIRWAKPNGGNAILYFVPSLGNVS